MTAFILLVPICSGAWVLKLPSTLYGDGQHKQYLCSALFSRLRTAASHVQGQRQRERSLLHQVVVIEHFAQFRDQAGAPIDRLISSVYGLVVFDDLGSELHVLTDKGRVVVIKDEELKKFFPTTDVNEIKLHRRAYMAAPTTSLLRHFAHSRFADLPADLDLSRKTIVLDTDHGRIRGVLQSQMGRSWYLHHLFTPQLISLTPQPNDTVHYPHPTD